MLASSTPRAWVAALATAAALAGCGPTPPQAPVRQAKQLDAATSDIATECGLAYQTAAFGGERRRGRRYLASLDAQAVASARSLASVDNLNPKWIYQGEQVGEIVSDALAVLDACGLDRAGRTLRRARSAPGRHTPTR